MPEAEGGLPSGGSPAKFEVRVRADGPGSAAWRVLLTLRWRADDPLSIDAEVCGEPPHPSLPQGQWVLLRDLLCRGLQEPTGDGGVQLRPDPPGDRLHIRLRRDDGTDVLLRVPAAPIRGFLRQTRRVVPAGGELPPPLLDDLVNRLRRS